MRTESFIGGEWFRSDSGKTIAVTNPATDEHIADVPDCGEAEAERAIGAAHEALIDWRERTAEDRGGIVRKLGELMLRDRDRLAELMTREQGKPLKESDGEIAYAAGFLIWAGEEAKRLYGETIPASDTHKRILAIRQPVGVAAIITPWNFPAAMITRKLGPALACGCTTVIKPGQDTPLSALAIAELCEEAGVPAGVVNILTGEASTIGKTMLSDDRVRKLSFTGSTGIGKKLMKGASENLLRLSLELGGHAPFIVFDDADLDAAVQGAIASKFRNAGQTCICANRFFVQSGVYDAFMDRFREAVAALEVGDGLEDGVDIGPLISDAAVEKVEQHIADVRDKGGEVTVGGERAKVSGKADRFFQPTVIEGFTRDMLCVQEETFGPVAPVARFEDEDEAIERANDTPYGLAGYFYTRDVGRLMRAAERLEYGIVGANDGGPSTPQAPFGGVKHSGFGREGGKYAMDEYTSVKYISIGL